MSYKGISQADTVVYLTSDVARLVIKDLTYLDYCRMENDSLNASIIHLKDYNQNILELNGIYLSKIDRLQYVDSVNNVILTERRDLINKLNSDLVKVKKRRGYIWMLVGGAFIAGLAIGL